MRYITGEHALNLNCSLETCGDWHQSAIQWERPTMRDTDESIFGDYGIEKDVSIPEHDEKFYVANHIRALLDLLEMGLFTLAQGMRDDFICNDKYTPEVFRMVSLLRNQANWEQIDRFMEHEYMMEWVKYRGSEKVKISSCDNERSPREQLIDEINASDINTICMNKVNAYVFRNNIRDVYDICFICKHYYSDLEPQVLFALQNAITYKGIEWFNYIVSQQKNQLIDKKELAEDFLRMFDKLNLVYDDKEKRMIVDIKAAAERKSPTGRK